jgi:hypothetical protein
MKIDHFAEFRRSSSEDRGNKGNKVTSPKNNGETLSFCSAGSVTQSCEQHVTRVTKPESNSGVTSVTLAVDEWVTEQEPEKSNQNKRESESVTSVTHVTQKDCRNNECANEKQAAWTRFIKPNSRSPLIPTVIRAKIEAIEHEARHLGWPPELLWNSGFWDSPRGLAAILDLDDEIIEVTPECIAISKYRRDIQRFRRHAA